jgi:plasmid rolling circle replication initiator protein Rep
MGAIVPKLQSHATPVPDGYSLLRNDSPQDAHFDDLRAWADAIQRALLAAGLTKQAQRVSRCATELFFDLRADADGVLHHKLASAWFCHFRHCSMCQHRRSLRHKAKFLAALPRIEAAHPLARWLLLTLTVRNCPVTQLRSTIGAMNKGWNRFVQRPEFAQVKGWVRATEVTRNRADDSAHPHFHCLLMVPPSYFSGKHYVTQERWAQVWREVMRLEYHPVVDIRAVRPKMVKGQDGQLVQSKSPLAAAVAEVLKYSTKAADLVESPEWLAAYIRQVHCLKFLTSGGALKGIFKESEDDDLVHVADEEQVLDDPIARLRYDWHPKPKRYARKRAES